MKSLKSPIITALLISLFVAALACVLAVYFKNAELKSVSKTVFQDISARIQVQQDPSRKALEKIVEDLGIQKISLYRGNDESPMQVVDRGDESILASLFSNIESGRQMINGTIYAVNFRLGDNLCTDFMTKLLIIIVASVLVTAFFVAKLVSMSAAGSIDQLKMAIKTRDFAAVEDGVIAKQLSDMLYQYNSKITELKNENENLKLLVDQDSLTGIPNRKKFNADLHELLSNKENGQVSLLAIIRATELTNINQTRGFIKGDQYLQDIANIICTVLKKFSSSVTVGSDRKPESYRLSGSDFAMIVPYNNPNVGPTLIKELKSAFDAYMAEKELDSVAYTGITPFKTGDLSENVLARADIALSEAQTSSVNTGLIKEGSDSTHQCGEGQWKEIVKKIINDHAFMLLQQPIQSFNYNARTYNVIYTRFVNEEGLAYPTETVFAMAQRHDMLLTLEQSIIEHILLSYKRHNLTKSAWGINLSINAMLNPSFVIWLERKLLVNEDITDKLVFEVSENVLECSFQGAIRLFDMFRRVKVKACISKFGNGLGSFRLFRELKPDYVKLDPSLVETLDRDSVSQQFVRLIGEALHLRDCYLIAEGVEEKEQKELLQSLYIDAIQGYLIARPQPLDDGGNTDFVGANTAGVGNDNSATLL